MSTLLMRLNLSFITLPKDASGSRAHAMNVVLVRLRILIMNLFKTFDPEERDVRRLLSGDKHMDSNGLAANGQTHAIGDRGGTNEEVRSFSRLITRMDH